MLSASLVAQIVKSLPMQIPHAVGKLGLWATTTEAHKL